MFQGPSNVVNTDASSASYLGRICSNTSGIVGLHMISLVLLMSDYYKSQLLQTKIHYILRMQVCFTFSADMILRDIVI